MRTDTWQCIVETSNKSYKSSGEGNGNPLQYSCLENSMDREVQWATVHGVAKRWIRLSTHAYIGEKKKCIFLFLPPRWKWFWWFCFAKLSGAQEPFTILRFHL